MVLSPAHRPRSSGWGRLLAAGALIMAALLAGCGPGGSAAGPSSAEPSGGASTGLGPGDVALRYVRAIFGGDLAAARRLVEPSSQDAQKLVELGIGQQKLSSRDLAVGSSVIDGDHATVVVTGTLCRRPPSAASSSPPDCISNTDARSSDPVFRVYLARQADRSWLVSLQLGGLSGEPSDDPSDGPPSSATSAAAGR